MSKLKLICRKAIFLQGLKQSLAKRRAIKLTSGEVSGIPEPSEPEAPQTEDEEVHELMKLAKTT